MNPIRFAYKAVRALVIPKYRVDAVDKLRRYIFSFLDNHNLLTDAQYLKFRFKQRTGKKLNLKKPRTLNEKIQWLKLYDHRPLYTSMTDKYEAKKYIDSIIGSKYIIPTLGVYDTFDEIDFDVLPDAFVLKTTHDSGGVMICTDKEHFDFEYAEKRFTKLLRRNYYMHSREWSYKNIKPRIIAEEYIGSELAEYKIFCFNGRPSIIMICRGKAHAEGRTNDLYDIDFNHIPVTVTYPNSGIIESRPPEFDDLMYIASKLSADIPQVRVDTYLTGGKIYVGEMTFYSDSGFCRFKPEKYDEIFGSMLELPKDKVI